VLGAAQRLRNSREFAAAARAGRRVGRGALVVYLDLGELPESSPQSTTTKPVRGSGAGRKPSLARTGFVVSKAVGGAVTRNTVRRRLRHLVRERLNTLPAGATLIVRALPGAADLPYERLGADLDAALTAAREPRRPARRRP
jgi:ribonuclease P protein component